MGKTMLVLASVAVAMLVAGGVAWAATIRCPDAHHSSCKGTKKADTMLGNSARNTMYGKKGGDTMYGRGNFDALRGGPGSDRLYGGPQADGTIAGNEGSDKLYGGDGNDKLLPAFYVTGPDDSDDYIHGGKGADTIRSSRDNGPSHDFTYSGVDRIFGDSGDDHILVRGNAGPGDSAKDIVACGPGTDTVGFDEGVDVVDDTCEIKNPNPY
jgi:Ca2+-binding RTX toxin-like protein